MSKRGVVELGINAIIIMLLALVFLGLAIFWIVKGMSKPMPEGPDFPFRATIDDQIIYQQESMIIKPGSSVQTKIRVYNEKFSEEDNIKVLIDQCSSDDGDIVDTITMSSVPQKIKKARDATYLVSITASEGLGEGTYVCNVLAGVDDGSGGVVEDGSVSDQIYVKLEY